MRMNISQEFGDIASCHAISYHRDTMRHDMMSHDPKDRRGTWIAAPFAAMRATQTNLITLRYPNCIRRVTIDPMFAKTPILHFSKRAMRVETLFSTQWGRPYEAAGVIRNRADSWTELALYSITQ